MDWVKELNRWAPAALALLACVLAVVATSCERLQPAEAPARWLVEHGDEVVCVQLDDEQDRRICGTSFEVAQLIVALADTAKEREAPPLPSATPSAALSAMSADSARGGHGGG